MLSDLKMFVLREACGTKRVNVFAEVSKREYSDMPCLLDTFSMEAGRSKQE